MIEHQTLHGLETVFVFDHSIPLVHFQLILKLGSETDLPNQSGCMHLCAEMILRGTQFKNRHEFSSSLERMGTAFQISISSDLVIFKGTCLARFLQPTLELLFEAIQYPRFDQQEYEQIQQEILDALCAEYDEDETVADIYLRRALYTDQTRARLPRGCISDIETLTVEDIQQCHQRYFHLSSMLLGLAGDIQLTHCHNAFKKLEQTIVKIHAGPNQPLPLNTHPLWLIHKAERTQTQLRMAQLGPSSQDPQALAFWLGIMAFGGTFTSPFTREIREIRGWSYIAQADFRRESLTRGPVVLRTAPSVTDAIECLKVQINLYQQLRNGCIEEQAFHLAKEYVLNRFPFEIATCEDILARALHAALIKLPCDTYKDLPARLEKISHAESQHAVQHYLNHHGFCAVLVAPKEILLDPLKSAFSEFEIKAVDIEL